MEVALQNIGHTNGTAQHKVQTCSFKNNKLTAGSKRRRSGGAEMCFSGSEIDLRSEIIKGQDVTDKLHSQFQTVT
jgi:hypothetical protein